MSALSKVRGLALALVALSVGAVSASAQGQPAAATLVVRNAQIATMNPMQPRAAALAARGEWIIAVGSEADIARYIGPNTRVLDAAGRLVVPGFNDSHAHFAGGAGLLSRLNLYGVDTKEEVLRLVEERVANAVPGEWITGSRYDHTLWGPGDDWPTKEDLDRISPENPVVLGRASGHSWSLTRSSPSSVKREMGWRRWNLRNSYSQTC